VQTGREGKDREREWKRGRGGSGKKGRLGGIGRDDGK